MIPSFTEEDKTILKGKVLSIARKYGCSHTYINLMLEGKIEIASKKSKKVFNGIKETIEFFQPVNK